MQYIELIYPWLILQTRCDYINEHTVKIRVVNSKINFKLYLPLLFKTYSYKLTNACVFLAILIDAGVIKVYPVKINPLLYDSLW